MSGDSRKKIIQIGACLGAAFFAFAWWQFDSTRKCGSDFVAFYCGGKLAWTPDLYDQNVVRQVQMPLVGCTGTFAWFVRLPYYAALVWPLAQLPYEAALRVWQALSLAALAAFVWCWREDRWLAALVCVWSLPMLANFIYGQDALFILLCAMAALLLLERSRSFAAGLLLSLCAAKLHLFLPLALLIAGRGLWSFGGGLLAGGAALAALSFAAGGLDWPARFLAAATNPDSNPRPFDMVNLRGLVHDLPRPLVFEVALAVVVLALAWRTVRRADLRTGFAAVLAAGVLTGHHSYLYDLLLFFPAALLALTRPSPRWLIWITVIFLLPATFMAHSYLKSVMPLVFFIAFCFAAPARATE